MANAKNVAAGTDEEWETAVAESGTPVKFNKVGDSFTGKYLGSTVISFDETDSKTGETKTNTFNQHQFVDETSGEVFTLNGGFKIDRGFLGDPEKNVPGIAVGKTVRITHTGTVDTGQPAPMKDYRIDVRK